MFQHPLVFLMAHAASQRTLRGVTPVWQRLVKRSGVGARLVIASPKDAAVEPWPGVKADGYPPPQYVTAGLQQHFGTIAHARMKEYCNIIQEQLYRLGNDCVWIAEYDSLILGNRLPFEDTEEDCMRAFEIPERDPVTGNHFQGFTAEKYYHGPWWFSRKTFFAFNEAFQQLPADCERGLVDRTIGLVVEQARIRVCPTNKIHFTANFISYDMVLALLHGINAGAVIIHGFKLEKRNNIL